MTTEQVVTKFFGSLERWSTESDGTNFTRAQVLAVSEHISKTGDCLWHAEHLVLWPNNPCPCSPCQKTRKSLTIPKQVW